MTGAAHPVAFLLGAGAGLWVAGFDVLYALADVDFDRTHGVHSIPARFGVGAALAWSRAVHALAWVCLAGAVPLLVPPWWYGVQLGWYGAGLLAMGGLLVYEHSLLSAADLSRLNRAFFDLNGVISVVFFITTALSAVVV